MDPLLAPLLEMGSTGALVAVVLTAFKIFEAKSAKRNGGTVYTKVEMLEKEVDELKESIEKMEDKLDTFHRDFCIFREEIRLHLAKQAVREEVLKEIKINATGN